MRKLHVFCLFCLIFLSATIFFACKKSFLQGDETQLADVKAASNEALSISNSISSANFINTITRDENWKIIAANNAMVMSKILAKKIDVNKFDFKNEEAFLELIDMDRKTYLQHVSQNKVASRKLLQKMKEMGINTSSDCITCTKSNEDLISDFKKTIIKFQEMPAKFKNFNRKSLKINSTFQTSVVSASDITDGETSEQLCCPFAFYACCAVCAGTIEIFPVYLACCYLCGVEYCCPNFKL
jgi:hypothetical protein